MVINPLQRHCPLGDSKNIESFIRGKSIQMHVNVTLRLIILVGSHTLCNSFNSVEVHLSRLIMLGLKVE